MANTSAFGSPIPLSEIESVLAWVDTFKLSRPTKKINRDFSDAVLLAEMLLVHYPKLVEMHNYPPRNSHALKLNNWMTLNRKVLKKLKLTLCVNTMEQLANSAPGVIERVLIMLRDKIRRDEELNKSTKEADQNLSSGGSYYEACGDEEHVLVVPVKTRVSGVLETVHQKVVSHDAYLHLKEELKDSKDTTDLLKQKVEHLDSLLKVKDERIEELQKQLDRKQARRKEVEALQNSLQVPFELESPGPPPFVPVPQPIDDITVSFMKEAFIEPSKDLAVLDETSKASLNTKDSISKSSGLKAPAREESKIPVTKESSTKLENLSKKPSDTKSLSDISKKNFDAATKLQIEISKKPSESLTKLPSDILKRTSELLLKPPSDVFKIPSNANVIPMTKSSNPSITEVFTVNKDRTSKSSIRDIENVKSDVFKDPIELDKNDSGPDADEFKESEQNLLTIEDSIHREMKEIINTE